MKFVSNKIETYVSNVTRTNLHPYLETTFKNIYELNHNWNVDVRESWHKKYLK